MSLWHLSPPLSACVDSSDLFTFTLVFQRSELETAEDWFVYQLMEVVIAGSLSCTTIASNNISVSCFSETVLIHYLSMCIFVFIG